MGHLWRSEDMVLVQVHMQREAAHDTVEELGNLGVLQFRDLNTGTSAFQRLFANDVKRCEEMERRLRYFSEQIASSELRKLRPQAPDNSSLETLEAEFEVFERELREVNSHTELLNMDRNRLIELHHVLAQDGRFFDVGGAADRGRRNDGDVAESLLEDGGVSSAARGGRLGFVAGVIARDKLQNFERVLFRATRGNLLLRQAEIEEPIEDPASGTKMGKSVFIVFFSGERSKAKIVKICESFGANLYPYPDNSADVRAMSEQVNVRLRELTDVIKHTTAQKEALFIKIAGHIDDWRTRVVREKAILHTLNMLDFKTSRQSVMAEAWCPKVDIDTVQSAIRRGQKRAGAQVNSFLEIIQSKDTPPTYFRTDKVSNSFQAIVNSYGVARYKEVNPGVFTIVTFPFLFAVMFGDAGHGIMLTMAALFLVLKEDKLAKSGSGEMFNMIFGGRYVLLLMGFFSIYTGLLYNDWFSLSVNTFGTAYKFNDAGEGTRLGTSTTAFGLDASWYGSTTKLMYVNSFKMKLSVILGVIQMMAGITMSLFNHLHNKDNLGIFLEFIPEVIFMGFTFGYMVIIIFIKWSVDYIALNEAAPNLLLTMTDFFLKVGGVTPGNELYAGQSTLQTILLLAALLSVPVLLLGKPLVLRARHRKQMAAKGRAQLVSHEDVHVEESHGGHGHGHGEEFDFGEIMVHQMIHTIEFVLGAVSNTASYLRLWALSLAHSQLSEVFWEQLMVRMMNAKGGGGFSMIISVYIAFAIWLGCTIGVLLLMESLSAFLHALRLHWVEYQNKFYAGDGHAFIAFNINKIVANNGAEDKGEE